MYETTDSQHLKLKEAKISEYVTEIIKQKQIAICGKSLSVGCLWRLILWHYHCFISTNVSGSKSDAIVQCFVCLRFLFLDLTSFVENVLSHKYTFPNIECVLVRNFSV